MNTPKKTKLSFQKLYVDFVSSLRIRNVRLTNSSCESLARTVKPSDTKVDVDYKSRYVVLDDSTGDFEVLAVLRLDFSDIQSGETRGHIEVGLAVHYSSDVAITEQIFNEFDNSSVPVNVWPYMREYVHQTLLRMGWPPFILPPYRIMGGESDKPKGGRTSKAKKGG